MSGGDVSFLARVRIQIVKLEWFSRRETNSFQLAHPHGLLGTVLMKFPVEKLVSFLLFAEQGGECGNAVDVRGRFDAGNLCGGRQKIPERPDLIADLAGFDVTRP